MTKDVKRAPRRYNSKRRTEQARQTRDAVLGAAHELFVAQGWKAATIAAIAKTAGVSNETVYAGFGNKAALLRALVTRAVRRENPETPLMEQAVPAGIVREPDPRRQIEDFATDIADVLERVAPLIAVLRAAAETEPEMARLYAEIHAGRRNNLRVVATALAGRGAIAKGIGPDQATSIIWRLASPNCSC